MYYLCTRDLWSEIIEGLLKFSKDGIYECVQKDVYINNQGNIDYIHVEGWQKYFIPIDLDDVNIEEIKELIENLPVS